ncbi:MAG: hypothetical protein NVSMB21_08410 [Vulcanimicrobiaceae bacterium]
MLRHGLRATALGALLVWAASPALAATGELPDLGPNVTVGRLPQGGTVIVRPTQGSPVAAIELWYRAPSTGFGAKPIPALARMAAQSVAGSKPLTSKTLGQTVAAAGGRLAITVYSDSIAISAVVPSNAAKTIVKAMTSSFFAPVTTEDGYRMAQRDVAQEAFIATFDAETVVRDALFAQLFSAGPQHYPSLGDPKSVANVSFADVKSFATRAFRSQNATLVVSGAVASDIVSSAVAGRPGPAGDGFEAASAPVLATATEPVSKVFVQASGGYGWTGPSISDQREATAMDFIADYLFRTEDGVVAKAVSQQSPQSLLVGQFITLHDPGVMFVAFSGQDATLLRGLVDEGLATIKKPLPARTFAAAVESFKYHLLSDLQTPTQQADNFGWYSVEGSATYAPGANGENGAYFKAASSLTAEFVATVAERYLGKKPAVVTLAPAPEVKKPPQEHKL